MTLPTYVTSGGVALPVTPAAIIDETGAQAGTTANPLKVTSAGGGAVTIADGANVTQGAKADAADPSTDTTPISLMSVQKQISSSIQSVQLGITNLLALLGVGVATLLKLVSSAYASTHAGVMMLAVRRDGVATPFPSANGQYGPLQTDAFSLLKIGLFDTATGSPLTYTTTTKGYQQITTLSTVQVLTVPNGATWCNLQAETQNVRWRDDGSNPSASVGMLLQAGDSINYDGDMSAIRFIETAASAKLNISYYA